MDISLNNEQVAEIAGKNVTMIPYTDIHFYENIEDLFASDYVLINYLTKKNYGHWVGLHKSKNRISFFDSYGRIPDDQLEYIPIKYRIESNQDYPYLVKLMKKWVDEDPKRSIHYNNEQFQRYSSKIATCGRWVGFYLRYSDDTTIEQFQKMMNSVKNKETKNMVSLEKDMFFDRLIVKLTDPYLE
jgi:hypothetical protein